MKRVISTWSGVAGPASTTMYFIDGDTGAVAATRAFWAALASSLPNEVSIQVENQGDTVSALTGAVTGDWSEASVAVVTGTDALQYYRGAGAFIQWNTGTVINGRRVKGRTYVVPIGGSRLDTDGSLTAAGQTAIDDAAEALITDLNSTLQVWHRPNPPNAGNGSSLTVTSATVPIQGAILRSRRD